jgi:hypothetical protein
LEAYRATGDKKYLDRDAVEWWPISTSYTSQRTLSSRLPRRAVGA